VKMP